jgi:hypothetical protein
MYDLCVQTKGIFIDKLFYYLSGIMGPNFIVKAAEGERSDCYSRGI